MARKYIDANILFKNITDHHYLIVSYSNSTDYGMFTTGIKQAIDEIPAADVQEVRHWISVKDRLPNPEERVLVFVKALGKIDNIHKDVITTNWITSSGNWIGNWKDIGNYVITHWMPLPDPPSTTDGGDTNT